MRIIQRASMIALATLALTASVSVQPAFAQNLFEALFGGFERRASPPPQATSFADPLGLLGNDARQQSGDVSGPPMTYCVRACDGRFFPVQRNAGASHAEVCKSFCPSAKTMVFSGSKIDHAVSANGTRYAELENAFVYRDKVVDNCTCNGKDAFGVARLSVASDPTLRPGDIVATNEGLATFRGKSSKSVEFTPIKPSSSEMGRRLAATKVTPQPEPEKVTPIADDPAPRKTRNRAAQYAK
jgi:Protein of unknown function (DUF2865)